MRIVRASHEAYSSQSPPAARALIKKTFEVEPLARLTAHDAARHPWFTELRRPQLDGADVIGAPQLGEGKTTGGAPPAVASRSGLATTLQNNLLVVLVSSAAAAFRTQKPMVAESRSKRWRSRDRAGGRHMMRRR